MQAFGLQPLYGRDAAQMAPMLLSNFADVAAGLQQAASELALGNLAILQSLTGDLKLSHLTSMNTMRDVGYTCTMRQPPYRAWANALLTGACAWQMG